MTGGPQPTCGPHTVRCATGAAVRRACLVQAQCTLEKHMRPKKFACALRRAQLNGLTRNEGSTKWKGA